MHARSPRRGWRAGRGGLLGRAPTPRAPPLPRSLLSLSLTPCPATLRLAPPQTDFCLRFYAGAGISPLGSLGMAAAAAMDLILPRLGVKTGPIWGAG